MKYAKRVLAGRHTNMPLWKMHSLWWWGGQNGQNLPPWQMQPHFLSASSNTMATVYLQQPGTCYLASNYDVIFRTNKYKRTIFCKKRSTTPLFVNEHSCYIPLVSPSIEENFLSPTKATRMTRVTQICDKCNQVLVGSVQTSPERKPHILKLSDSSMYKSLFYFVFVLKILFSL